MDSPGDRPARALLPGWGPLRGLGTWGRRLLVLGVLGGGALVVWGVFVYWRKRGEKRAPGAAEPAAICPEPSAIPPAVPTPVKDLPEYLGLVNQGATCYLNSVLQCLFFTQELRDAVLSCEDLGESSLVTQLQRVFVALQAGPAPVTTTAITHCLGLTNVYKQRDILECFQTLLIRMAAERAELGELFQMTTEHVIRCLVCGDETRLEEARLFLVVPVLKVPGGSLCSVEQAVKALFQKDEVIGDSQCYCDKCDLKVDVCTELCLRTLPPVLVIFLERFTFSYGAFQKLEDNVTVSATLTLPSPDKNSYDLFAVSHHFGDLKGGHYVADIKSSEKHCWYRFSDDFVMELPQGPSTSRTAYLLMYRRGSHGR